MDFFDRMKQPSRYEVPVIEKRDHANKGKPAWNRGFDYLDPETRQKVTLANRNKIITAETRAKISAALKGIDTLAGRDRTAINTKKKTVHTPHGVFRSAGEASRKLDIHLQTLVSRIKNTKNPKFVDWYYVEEAA